MSSGSFSESLYCVSASDRGVVVPSVVLGVKVCGVEVSMLHCCGVIAFGCEVVCLLLRDALMVCLPPRRKGVFVVLLVLGCSLLLCVRQVFHLMVVLWLVGSKGSWVCVDVVVCICRWR